MYKILKTDVVEIIVKIDTGMQIPRDTTNTDYQQYKKWLKETDTNEKDLPVEDITPAPNDRVQVMYDAGLGKLVYHSGGGWETIQ